MAETETLSASLEDYLEAISHVVVLKGAARAKDISRRLKVNSSSVTGALRALADRELVNYAPYDVITLTPKGARLAKDVIRRHEVLRDFFVHVLGADDAEGEEGACKVEHAVPRPILERLIRFIDFLESCPRAGANWIQGFNHYCGHGAKLEDCERCVSLSLEEVRKKRKKTVEGSGTLTLPELKPGHRARVLKIRGRGSTNKRIRDMGIVPGAVIEVERVAPRGDPVEVKVRGYHHALNEEEATRVTVELK
jgi:DtxR family Mn-dependent transcriptional regulator